MRQFTNYTFALVMLLGFLFLASPALAFNGDEECKELSGTAEAVVTGPDTASETITFTLGNKSYVADSTIKFAIVPQPDGSLGAVSTHFLIVKDAATGNVVGTISTEDTGTLTPTETPGVFRLESDLVIVSGTRRFENSTGTIHASALLNFTTNPPSSTSTVSGTVCKVEE